LSVFVLACLFAFGCSVREVKEGVQEARELGYKATGMEWMPYAETDLYRFYFNSRSLDHSHKQYVKAWTKAEPRNDEAREELVKKKQGGGQYLFTVTQYEIDCANRMIRLVSTIDYGDMGVMSADTPRVSRWAAVVAGSDSDRLQRAVCP
jgi:hypothetical protein